jgi:hypothetical protein
MRAVLDVFGRDSVIGKDAVRVRLVPDEDARRPAFPFGAGDSHDLVVDAETGVTLALTSFVDGKPFQHHEVTDLELNAVVPDALTAVPPGAEAFVARPPLGGPGDLAATADLQVLSPTWVPEGFMFDARGSHVDRRNPASVQVIFERERREFVTIFEAPASEPLRDGVYDMEEVRRGDRAVAITDVSDAAGMRWATAERAGTRAIIHCSLPANELLDLAFSLEVVTPTRSTRQEPEPPNTRRRSRLNEAASTEHVEQGLLTQVGCDLPGSERPRATRRGCRSGSITGAPRTRGRRPRR